MFTNSAAPKINNQLIQVQELFTSDFENPLKEKIKQVFDDNFDSKLEKAIEKNIEKLKGVQGEQGLQGNQGEQGLQGLQGLEGKQGLKGSKGDKGDNGTVDYSLITADVNKATTELFNSIDLEKLKGEKGDPGAKGDAGLPGKDGADGEDAKLDYEFIKKELASLFEEWKANLGDLTGKQGERGDKGDKGLDGAEYPTYDKQLFSDDLIPVAKHKLPMTSGKAIVSIVGVSNLSAFIDLEENIMFQNLGGESKLLGKGRFNGVPSNSANLSYEINIANGFLNVLVAGKNNEIFDVKVIIK